ncbi:MAG: HAD-IIIA family hydrolase [Victivallaceae bacterium]|nr:HAD-IIIA family hydrolase [Victivallaceae bacterium]
MPQVIIFDLDGTLIDSRQDLTTAVNLTREFYNLPPLSLETVCSYIGNGARKLIERSLPENINIEDALPIMKKHYYAHLTDETKLYPGVLEGLQKLVATGRKLAVITNKPDAAAKIVLKELGIAEYFDEIMGGGCGHPLKPEPDALLYFAKKWNADVEKSWMVGDHYTDLESGARAGMKCCWASYGFGDPKGLAYDLDAKSFAEFAACFL